MVVRVIAVKVVKSDKNSGYTLKIGLIEISLHTIIMSTCKIFFKVYLY